MNNVRFIVILLVIVIIFVFLLINIYVRVLIVYDFSYWLYYLYWEKVYNEIIGELKKELGIV